MSAAIHDGYFRHKNWALDWANRASGYSTTIKEHHKSLESAMFLKKR
jgi:hypothetical protein